ncbi:MAG: 50S ribosomal protein L29 [Candidatus Nanoarchaeia archaeon]
MKAKEIRSMHEKDIESRVRELRKELIKHNAQVATGTQVKSAGSIKQTKKTIARLMTILSEKRRGEKAQTNE